MAKKIFIAIIGMVIFTFTGCRASVSDSSRNATINTVEQQSKTTTKQLELEPVALSNITESWRNIPYEYDEVDMMFECEGIESTIVLKESKVEVIRNNEIISTTAFPEDVEENARKDIFYGYLVGNEKAYYVLLNDKMQKPTIEFVEISNEALSIADNKVYANGFIGSFPIFEKESGDYVAYIPNDSDSWNYMALQNNLFMCKEGKENKMTFRETVLDSKKFELSYIDSENILMNPAFWRLKVFFNEDESIYSEGRLALSDLITDSLTETEIKLFEGKYNVKEFSKIIKKMNNYYEEKAEVYYNSLLKTK